MFFVQPVGAHQNPMISQRFPYQKFRYIGVFAISAEIHTAPWDLIGPPEWQHYVAFFVLPLLACCRKNIYVSKAIMNHQYCDGFYTSRRFKRCTAMHCSTVSGSTSRTAGGQTTWVLEQGHDTPPGTLRDSTPSGCSNNVPDLVVQHSELENHHGLIGKYR